MDMHRTAQEIGLFLTAINLVAVMNSPDVQDKVGASMPLPDSDTEKKVSDIAKWLAGFGKRKYIFLTEQRWNCSKNLIFLLRSIPATECL